MTTAMQDLYAALENSHPDQWKDILINDKKKLIQKEKETIIDARATLYAELFSTYVNAPRKYCEEYYNKTFQQ